MFIDRVRIFVKAGNGGNGAVSFRREKYVPMGGPDGGDGGRGGSIIFLADERLRSLVAFRTRQHFKAANGKNGAGKNMTGASGEDLILPVPVGTVVKEGETGETLIDLSQPGRRVVFLEGGRGGKGNAHFVSSTRRSPRIAQKGEPGEGIWVEMELKLISDVGLIGMPNAGKSTLISRISAARPKIADYPFTTLEPNLGVVNMGDEESFVVADIPGLIEGAHAGVGLGHDFLRHVERTRLLVHIIDPDPMTGREPYEDFVTINRELELYNPELMKKPQLVAVNKSDIFGIEERVGNLVSRIEQKGYRVFRISAVTGDGVKQLLYAINEELKRSGPVRYDEDDLCDEVINGHKEHRAPNRQIDIVREGKAYVVRGEAIERRVASIDLTNHDSLIYLQRLLRRYDIIGKLKDMGVKDGDTVRIAGFEFDFLDEDEW